MSAPESTQRESASTTVNANIRAEMARRNVSNAALCERLGFSTNAFWRRVHGGVTAWNVDELEKVADLFGVQVIDLFRAHP